MKTIVIVGAGMMGSAMSYPARDNGNCVRLVGTPLDREIIDEAKKTGWHKTLKRQLPEGIEDILAVDMGCVGDDLACDETMVSICVKDSAGPYHYGFTNELIALAKEKGIHYAADVYPSYSSDTATALRAGNDCRFALIGTGVFASHGYERTHVQGVENTCRLILSVLEK